jgi:long-chain acyl-CoA synthetase
LLPEITKEAFDEEGWFNSGDVGKAYENGSISIIDRAKMIMKLSQGEYVAPQKLEGAFGISDLIGPCFVYANSLKSNTVMIVTLDEGAEAWAKKNGKPSDSTSISQDPDFKKAVIAEIARICKAEGFNNVEKPRDVFISDQVLSVENGCVTPTFKMKRNGVQALFQKELDDMYAKIDIELAKRDAQ